MRLSPGAFNALLSGNLAQDLRWRASTTCPCISAFSGAAAPGCPKCAGKGRLWAAPVACKAGVTSQKISAQLSQQFNMEAGDALITVDESSPLYDAGQYDRVTMLNSTDRFSLALTRGDVTERLYMQVQKIDRVFWYTGQAGQGDVVEGGIPVVDDAGGLTWTSGAPPDGVSYSITGTRFAEFFVYLDLPANRGHHGGARLPKRMPVRRFDLFGR